MTLILPKYLEAERQYADRKQKVDDCADVIGWLYARSIREDLEEIVHKKYPRMPVRTIKRAKDETLARWADPEIAELPRYLYMSREDFYDVDDGLYQLITSYGLEPIWNNDMPPGRVTVLTESKYQRINEIARFHDRTDETDIGAGLWLD